MVHDCTNCGKKEICFLYEKQDGRCRMICSKCGECVCHPTTGPQYARVDQHYIFEVDFIICGDCYKKL